MNIVTSNRRYKKLPSDLFLVRVPMIATYSDYELNNIGMPVNVVNGIPDHSTYNSMTVVMLPLDRIIDIYISGYPIRLCKTEDLETIYSILDEYVRGVELNPDYRFNLNQEHIVEDRLYEIERFAAEIFDTNKFEILKQSIDFKHGYTVDMDIMDVDKNYFHNPANNQSQQPTHIYNDYRDSYTTVLSSNNGFDPTPVSSSITTPTTEVEDSVRARCAYNPNKPDLDGYTYVNNNLPKVDISKINRIKNVIKIV